MKALVLKGKNKLAIEDFSMDEPLTPEDVKIQIREVGICGSDVHYYLHGRIGDFVVEKPMVLGHEASGVVLDVGGNVRHLKVGDRVCINGHSLSGKSRRLRRLLQSRSGRQVLGDATDTRLHA